MRARDSDQGYESNLRPKASRMEEPESALAMRAALSGRLDAAGAAGVMGLQRAVGNAGAAALIEEERSPVHDVIGSGGTPLPADLRADMEGRFGQDFGDVRVHNDGAAQESANRSTHRPTPSGRTSCSSATNTIPHRMRAST